jgi:uncharacterized protein
MSTVSVDMMDPLGVGMWVAHPEVGMHLDIYVVLAGFLVGAIVGMTGMGGGALMTPILVLVFGIQPLAAVSSDLVASMVMRPIGGIVHLRRGTVRKDLVKWLALGSVPAAFAGVFVLRAMGDSQAMQDRLRLVLGAVLALAAVLIVVKAWMQSRERRRRHLLGPAHVPHATVRVRPIPTLIVGAVGGLVVGMTSVGSGSLVIVSLMLMYPAITASELVGNRPRAGRPTGGRGRPRPHPVRRLPARTHDGTRTRERARGVPRRPVLL